MLVYGHKEALFPAILLGLMLKNIPYIPIDKIYPVDRIKRIIEIAEAQVLFNCGNYQLDLSTPIIINKDLKIHKRVNPDFSITYGSKEDPVRYIIFTSGSTGEPKGVQITHQALCSFMEWVNNDFGITTNDVYMNQAPFSFDLSVYELSMYLHFGGTLVLNEITLNIDRAAFIARLKEYNQSVWVSTPSFAYLFLREDLFNTHNLPAIKIFLFCGETLPVQTAQRLLILFPNARVLNTYGPTEATVATTIVNITPDVIKKYPSFLPVGYCKKASQLVIKNESDNPGEAGDIVIVGDNVSIGYLKRPELNEKSFFTYNKRRAYNTGDQGYIKDDMLFFLGRNDDQVKLHGYRIELDEISTQLKYHPLIDEVATIPLKKGTEVVRIISYVLLKDKTTKSTKEELIEFLSHKLPIYMLPSDIRFINELPYNNNFKIDRKKLAEMYITGK